MASALAAAKWRISGTRADGSACVQPGDAAIQFSFNTRNADWVIDLGPDVGSRGGKVVFEGTLLEL